MAAKEFNEKRILELADRLDLPFYAALGVLECLWHFTSAYAPKGNVGKWSNQSIARSMKYPGDPDALIEALLACRFLVPHPEHRLAFHRYPTRTWITYQEGKARRRERVLAAGGDVTRRQRRLVFEQAGHKCVLCGSAHKLSVDHKIPVALGGTRDTDNLQCLCQRCNSSKGAKVERAG